MHDWYLSSTDRDEEIHERVRAEVAGKSDEDILAGNDGVVAAIAWKLAEIGETDRAIRLMEAVRHAPPLYMEEDGWGVILLARLYQHVGRDDDALPLLEEALEINKAKYAAGDRHPDTMSDLADIYARLDRSDEAYEMLHKALDYNFHWRGSFPGPDWLNLPEHVTRLAEDPRFIALEERNAMTREQMVSRIRSMLAQYDPDTLLAPALQLAEKWSES